MEGFWLSWFPAGTWLFPGGKSNTELSRKTRCQQDVGRQDEGTMKWKSLARVVPATSILFALRSKGAPVRVDAVTPAGFGIAVQCWSFREFTLFEAMEMAALAGAGGIEFYPGQKIGGAHGNTKFEVGMDGGLVDAVLEKLAECGLKAWNFGICPVPADMEKAREVFVLAKRLGLYGITTESLESIDTLEKIAIEFDIKICFHNHPRPTKLWNPDTILKAIEGRHRNLGLCADLGHWASSGLDTLEAVKKAAPRIHSFHMKDREKALEWSHDRPFGTGVIDISSILDEARKHGFAGNVSIEYEHNWKTNLAEIAQCVGFLRGYCAA